jgi:hypothetical protein
MAGWFLVSVLAIGILVGGCAQREDCQGTWEDCNTPNAWKTSSCFDFPAPADPDASCPSLEQVQQACPVLHAVAGPRVQQGQCCYDRPRDCY